MNAVHLLQEMKRVHGICPCCGDVFRLSEAIVYINDPPPKTPFDNLYEARERFEQMVVRFKEEHREEIRRQETELGAGQAHEQLVKISPTFIARGISPEDVKVLFEPVRYVVFRGLNERNLTAVEFIDEAPDSMERERLLRSVEETITKGNLGWQTWHVDENGRVTVR